MICLPGGPHGDAAGAAAAGMALANGLLSDTAAPPNGLSPPNEPRPSKS